MEWHARTLTGLAAGLAAGEFTSVELTQALLSRIEAHDGALNAFVTVTADAALAAAARADEARAAGTGGPLNGLPIVHKDIFCTAGVRTTCGSRMLENFISPYDATVVERLAAAGAVVLGKTNMDEFAMGSSNETSYFGPVHNPWDLERSPGGSKPTYGRVSRYGMIAFASSLDQAGTITRSAEDAALLLGIMAGFDERDSTCLDRPVPDYLADLGKPIDGMRIGIVRQHFDEGLDPGCGARVREAIAVLESLGATTVEVDLPNIGLSVPTYYVVAPAECSSNLSRFDGVRFGHRSADAEDLADLYCRSRGEGFGDEVKRRIMTGTYVKAQQVRQLIADDFKKAFETVDVIAGPTAPSTAFKLGDKVDDPITMYLNDIYTIGANLGGFPGISVPCGLADGLPVGLHLVGHHFDESALLRCAHAYQQQTEYHTACPEDFK